MMKKARLCVLAVVLGLFILGLTSSNAGAVYQDGTVYLEDGSEDEVVLSDQSQPELGYVPGAIIVKFRSEEAAAQVDLQIRRAERRSRLSVNKALNRVSSIADFKATLGVKILEIKPVFPDIKARIKL